MSNDMYESQPGATGQSDETATSSQLSTYHRPLDRMSSNLLSRARDLMEQGNTRRLVLKREGRVMVDLPLTVAVVATAVVVVASPGVAVLGAVAALAARVSARLEHHPRTN